MNVTTEELLAEAGRMALELRFKDRAIAALEARVAELEQHLPARIDTDGIDPRT